MNKTLLRGYERVERTLGLIKKRKYSEAIRTLHLEGETGLGNFAEDLDQKIKGLGDKNLTRLKTFTNRLIIIFSKTNGRIYQAMGAEDQGWPEATKLLKETKTLIRSALAELRSLD